MYIYNVTINIKKDVEQEWFNWMKEKHLPDVIATGYFKAYKTFKIIIPSGIADESTYIIQYECDELEQYHQYIEKESARLQGEHQSKFPGKFTAARAVLQVK